jgi:chorismate-pyruvate lyase
MIANFTVQSKPAVRYHLVRDGQEVYVLGTAATPAERLELHERQLFPLARRRFGARLRAARRAENRVLWAGLAALEVAR